MPGSEPQPLTAWQPVSRYYRRPPGRGWWLALAAIPLLIALISQGSTDRPAAGLPGPAPAGPALTAPAEPEAGAVSPTGTAVTPLAILRNGDVVTLNGQLPDAATRRALLDELTAVFGPQVQLIDNLTVNAGVAAPDVTATAALFAAGITVTDLKFRLDSETVTLTGTAPGDREKAAVDAAARSAWPKATIVDNIGVRGPHRP